MTSEARSNVIYNKINKRFGDGELLNCLQCQKDDDCEITTFSRKGIDISLCVKPVRYDDPSIVFIIVPRDFHIPYEEQPMDVIMAMNQVYRELCAGMNRADVREFMKTQGVVHGQPNFYVGQNKAHKKGKEMVHGHVHAEFRTLNHEDQFTFARHEGIRKMENIDAIKAKLSVLFQ